MNVIEPAGESPTVAIERPSAQPGEPGPPVEGDDPVVQREAEWRQVLVGSGDRWEPFQRSPEVVAEEPHESAEESRRVGGDDHRRVQPADQAPRDRERVRSRGRRFQDGDRVGREVGPTRVPARPCALEQGQAGQVPERLGDIDRPCGRDAVRQPSQPQRGRGLAWIGPGDHHGMIRLPLRDAPRRDGR